MNIPTPYEKAQLLLLITELQLNLLSSNKLPINNEYRSLMEESCCLALDKLWTMLDIYPNIKDNLTLLEQHPKLLQRESDIKEPTTQKTKEDVKTPPKETTTVTKELTTTEKLSAYKPQLANITKIFITTSNGTKVPITQIATAQQMRGIGRRIASLYEKHHNGQKPPRMRFDGGGYKAYYPIEELNGWITETVQFEYFYTSLSKLF